MKGTVYTETVIHAAPQRFLDDAPYQIVIVTLEVGMRVTGRVTGDPVNIDDAVELLEERNGVPYFKKI